QREQRLYDARFLFDQSPNDEHRRQSQRWRQRRGDQDLRPPAAELHAHAVPRHRPPPPRVAGEFAFPVLVSLIEDWHVSVGSLIFEIRSLGVEFRTVSQSSKFKDQSSKITSVLCCLLGKSLQKDLFQCSTARAEIANLLAVSRGGFPDECQRLLRRQF